MSYISSLYIFIKLLLEYVISHHKEIETENWNKWLIAEMDDYSMSKSMAALVEGYVARLDGWAAKFKRWAAKVNLER
jgi:hypothetical protein